MKKSVLFFMVISLLINSCSRDDSFHNFNEGKLLENNDTNLNFENKKEKYLIEFASVLSRVVYDRKDVRQFLKKQSLKQFDKNFDVLYYLVSDELIGEMSFRDILISYSSLTMIEDIERNIPLLNVFVPEISFFDVYPDNLDVEDKEIPIVVSKKAETSLFLNGDEVLCLEKGEIPDFHVFVVNENTRVVVPENSRKSLKSGARKTIEFISPNYDGSLINTENAMLKSARVTFDIVGQKAIDSFNYFYKDDGSVNQKAFQRDYIYYGITPQNQEGSLNRSVSEYINFIEVNPNSYFIISDDPDTQSSSGDPRIIESETSQESGELTEGDLLDKMWTKGAYNIRFEVIRSTQEQPEIVYVPAKPNDLWNFNIEHSYRHSTWFRRSKNTYRIDPNKFTSKKFFLDEMVSLGKWDISEEALFRYVQIYEEDSGADVTEVNQLDMTRALKANFKGNSKVGVGLKVVNVEKGFSAEVESNTTEKISRSITIKRKVESNLLGKARVYFYDPLILSTNPASWFERVFLGGKDYSWMNTYNTGHIEFGIIVK